jgi:hypothetical protein
MSLAEFAGPEQVEVAAHAALIGAALMSRGLPVLEVAPGVGLLVVGRRIRPFVFVASEKVRAEPAELRSLEEFPEAWEIVRAALGVEPDWLSDTVGFALPSPEPHLSASDPITSPAIGTVGASVSWQRGSGFLTAGHVAPNVGASVFSGRDRLGTVQFANDPAGGGATIQADVAVVQLDANVSFSPKIGPIGQASPGANVKIRNAQKSTGVIMGFASFVYWPKVGGTYGDTYFTTDCITVGGDSGSAVLLDDGKLIGTVVGGVPKVATFIQDVRYQLARAAPSSGGLAGLTV